MSKLVWLGVLLCFFASSMSQEIVYLNPGCAQLDGSGQCLHCSLRYYMDMNGICQPVNPNCNTYNTETGACMTCYPGFALIQTTCLPQTVVPSLYDPYCHEFEGSVCVKCSTGFYFNEEAKCTQIDSNCKEFDDEKLECTLCYTGFKAAGKVCQRLKQEELDQFCSQFYNGVCIKCSFGFYFNIENICTMIPNDCADFNVVSRVCEKCFSGYDLDENQICVKHLVEAFDQNCRLFDINGMCLECSFGYYFDEESVCRKIPDDCFQFSLKEKKCQHCYTGYTLNTDNICVESTEEITDPNCNQFQNGQCVQCSFGFYFNQNLVCMKIPDTCKNFDTDSEKCLECYIGYVLNDDHECLESAEQVTDQYCRAWGENNICLECSTGAFLNSEGFCELVSPLCQEYSHETGLCTACFPGFTLTDGVCELAVDEVTYPNCNQLKDGKCVKCSFRFWKTKDGACKSVSPFCDDYSENTGKCLSCYVGFKLSDGVCAEDEELESDLCANRIDGVCVQCSVGSFFDETGKCTLADLLCKTINPETGGCTSCYTAFVLQDEKCLIDTNFVERDPFCNQFEGEICVRCSVGFFFNAENLCTKVSDLCATADESSGRCLSCYVGYALDVDSGRCVVDEGFLSDNNCAEFEQGVCVKCSIGFFFNEELKCQAASPLCKEFDPSNGLCTKCYVGFENVDGKCELSEVLQPSDPNCAEWADNNICLKCSSRAVFNELGVCTLVSLDCATYDDITGDCLTCYSGYQLRQTPLRSICIKSKIAAICQEYNQNNQCIKCAVRSFLNPDGTCTSVDDLCAEFDYDLKECIGCYSGYSLLSGKCEITQVQEDREIQNCYAYTEDGMCLECFERYWLSEENSCEEVDLFCKGYDNRTGDCTSCYESLGFALEDGKCVS